MVLVQAAKVSDCDALARTSKLAFDHDVKYGAPGPGGPPGYDSPEWHRNAFRWGRLFKLVQDGRIVGGAIVIVKSRDWMELGRIWLVPEAQNRGLGKLALRSIEELFPWTRRWTLGTPVWNLRNQHFYGSCGYRETGRSGDEVTFEKALARKSPAKANRGGARE